MAQVLTLKTPKLGPITDFTAKNGTESKFTTVRKIRNGSRKTLRRVLRNACFSRKKPENAKGGGKKEGVAKPHEETPHKKQFPTPLTSVRFAPPYGISLSKSLRSAQNFPQLTSSETAFGGSQKIVSDGPSSRGFAFRYVLPPTPLALPRKEAGKRCG